MPRVKFEGSIGSREVEITGDRETSFTRDRESGPRAFDTGWVIEEDAITDVQVTDLETGKVIPLALAKQRVEDLVYAYLRVTPPDTDDGV